MNSIKNLSVFLALALGTVATGCASDPVDDDGDNDGGDNGGDGGGGDGPGPGTQVDAVGTYRLQSKFDLAASAPGTVGDVVNTIIDITDDPEDPTLWIIDQALSVMPSGIIKSALESAKPYVAGYLNDRILDLAPDFVATAVELGDGLGQLAKNFGLNETLVVAGAPGAYAARLTLVGAHFKVDGVESDHAFADHGVAEVVIDPVGFTLEDRTKVAIGEHQFPISYGEVLRMGVDAVIVPMLEPGTNSLNELLAAKVNCALIGAAIDAVVFVGSAATYAGYCSDGLDAAADYIYSKIATIDGTALQFGMSGTAKALETTGDGHIDTIHTGAWTGTVSYGSTPAPLAAATFFGTRM